MPIIKDKYGAKGDSPRSSIVRDLNKSDNLTNTSGDVLNITGLNTQQKQAQATRANRIASGIPVSQEEALQEIVVNSGTGLDLLKNITSYKLAQTTPAQICELAIGETLLDIVVSHFHTSATQSRVSIYWSIRPIGDLEFSDLTDQPGVINTTVGGELNRIFTHTFNSETQFSIGDIIKSFSKLNTKIHLIAVAQIIGSEITVIKS